MGKCRQSALSVNYLGSFNTVLILAGSSGKLIKKAIRAIKLHCC